MKQIKVEVIEKGIDTAKMYDVSFYKKNGLFLWEEAGQLVIVNGGCVTGLWTDFEMIKLAEGIPDDVPVDDIPVDDVPDTVDQVVESGPAMVSEDLLLKAIAVASEPELITELVGKGD